MTRKSLVSLIIVCLFLLQTMGCSGFQLPEKKEPVTLRFLYEENSANYPALAQAFNKDHQDITIELATYKGLNDFYSSYASKMGSADVARLFVGASYFYSQQVPGGLLALDTMVTGDPNFPHSDLDPSIMDVMRIEEKLIGLPAGINPFVVYVNPEKFAAAGVPLPQPGWTVDEFVQASGAVHNISPAAQGTDQFAYGFCTDPFASDPGIFLRLFGGALADDEASPTVPLLNQPANELAMIWYASLFNDFQVTLPFIQSPQAAEQIRAGNCAMWLDVLSAAQYGKPTTAAPHPVPLPLVNDKPTAFGSIDSYVILAKSEHPEEAWLWIRFLMDHEQGSGTILPAVRSQIQSEGYRSSVSPAVLEVADALAGIEITQSVQWDQRLIQANALYYEALHQVLNGDADVKTALEQAQQKALKAWEE